MAVIFKQCDECGVNTLKEKIENNNGICDACVYRLGIVRDDNRNKTHRIELLPKVNEHKHKKAFYACDNYLSCGKDARQDIGNGNLCGSCYYAEAMEERKAKPTKELSSQEIAKKTEKLKRGLKRALQTAYAR